MSFYDWAFKRSEDIKPFYMKGNGAFAKGEKIPKTKLKLDCPGGQANFSKTTWHRSGKTKSVKVCLMFFVACYIKDDRFTVTSSFQLCFICRGRTMRKVSNMKQFGTFNSRPRSLRGAPSLVGISGKLL